MRLALVLVALAWAGPLQAQPTALDPSLALPTASARHAADVVSTVEVGVALGLDAWSSCVRVVDHRRGCLLLGARVGVVLGVTTAVKHLVQRTRPDGSDDQSFYSMHTALPASTLGGPRLVVTVPLTIGTGALRIAADKHYLTDTLVGAAVGALTGRFLR